MAAITRIDARVVTGTAGGAGTDGNVFLAIGGREFHLDSSANDFEAGSDRTYTMGVGANVQNAARNDPRVPQLDTINLGQFPVYIRFEPGGDWNLEEVTAVVNPGPSEVRFRALALTGPPDLWLGQDFGKLCFLARV